MKNGFTLIELMIVVAIIGILTTIAIPQYQQHLKKTELTAALATLTALKVNLESYILSHSEFPDIDEQDELTTAIGAVKTPLGSISTKQHVDKLQAGQMTLTLSGTQFKQDSNKAYKLALERDEWGLWHCITDIPESVTEKLPRGCERGTLY